jgi:hypothetical protein
MKRLVLIILIATFDLAIGLTAIFPPSRLNKIIHSRPSDELNWLQRTGTVWLFFSAVAFASHERNPRHAEMRLVLSLLHVMDGFADGVFRLSSQNLTSFGKLTFNLMPFLNFAVARQLLAGRP